MSKEVIAPALVYCSGTKEKTARDEDEKNFELYQYLTIDENGDRNIFCGDQPFLFEDDCKPYINIEPFPLCRSKYYGMAVKNLIAYTKNREKEAIKDKKNPEEILVLGEELSRLERAYNFFIDQQTLREKAYPCILQVLDRWFMASKKQAVDDYFQWSRETQTLLEEIYGEFLQAKIQIRKQIKKSQPSAWERWADAFSQLRIQMEDFTVSRKGKVGFSYKGFSRFDREWNQKQAVSWFDERIDELGQILNECMEMLYEELYFADGEKIEYVNCSLVEVKELYLAFCVAMEELGHEEPELMELLDKLKGQLGKVGVHTRINGEKHFIDKKSFLVCRCGGIINIVFDGQDMKKHLDRIEPNIIELLKWIEFDLFQRIRASKGEDSRIFLSYIDGFNFVRYMLLRLGEQSQFKYGLLSVTNGKVDEGFGAEIVVTVRPRSVINKKENMKEARNTLLEIGVGKLIGMHPVGKAILAGGTVIKFILNPDVDGYANASLAILENFGTDEIKKGAGIISKLSEVVSVISIIPKLMYHSNADYVGEIQVLVKMGTQEITYAKTYDFYGTPQEKIPNVNIVMHEKSVAGMNPSKCELYSDVVLDAWNYENVFKLDCMTIVNKEKNMEKIEVYKDDNDQVKEKFEK